MCDQDGSGSLDVKEIAAVAKACNKDLSPDELASMLAEIDADGNGSVEYDEFEQYWVSKFSGELVEGTALAAMLAAWTDVEHISGVAYHPDRYIDPDDEFRARVWYVFDEIDSNHDKCISYIEFIKCVVRIFCSCILAVDIFITIVVGGRKKTKSVTMDMQRFLTTYFGSHRLNSTHMTQTPTGLLIEMNWLVY